MLQKRRMAWLPIFLAEPIITWFGTTTSIMTFFRRKLPFLSSLFLRDKSRGPNRVAQVFLCLLLDKALTKTMSVTKSLHTETTKENYSASQTFMHFSEALKTVEKSLCIIPLRTKKRKCNSSKEKYRHDDRNSSTPDLPWFQFLSPIFVCCVWLDHMR